MADMRDRERLYTGLALALLTLLAWLYLLGHAAHVDYPPATHAPHGRDMQMLAMGMLMWTVMMIAMMLPGASPMILTFSKVRRQRLATGGTTAPTPLFVAGYLAVWTGFSVLAAVGQWSLHGYALLDSAMGRTGPLLGGGLLIFAGAFQWTSLKEACLTKCRTPLGFLLAEWREGWRGAFIMGLRHGAFCVGCCWALMLLMFVGGVMNLAWMGGLAVYMLAEKVVPGGPLFSRVTGILLIGAGVAVVAGGFVN